MTEAMPTLQQHNIIFLFIFFYNHPTLTNKSKNEKQKSPISTNAFVNKKGAIFGA